MYYAEATEEDLCSVDGCGSIPAQTNISNTLSVSAESNGYV